MNQNSHHGGTNGVHQQPFDFPQQSIQYNPSFQQPLPPSPRQQFHRPHQQPFFSQSYFRKVPHTSHSTFQGNSSDLRNTSTSPFSLHPRANSNVVIPNTLPRTNQQHSRSVSSINFNPAYNYISVPSGFVYRAPLFSSAPKLTPMQYEIDLKCKLPLPQNQAVPFNAPCLILPLPMVHQQQPLSPQQRQLPMSAPSSLSAPSSNFVSSASSVKSPATTVILTQSPLSPLPPLPREYRPTRVSVAKSKSLKAKKTKQPLKISEQNRNSYPPNKIVPTLNFNTKELDFETLDFEKFSYSRRKRKRANEVERHYKCSFPLCEKSYGTLNHLNTHILIQNHGTKRSPEEFSQLRKQLREERKEQMHALALERLSIGLKEEEEKEKKINKVTKPKVTRKYKKKEVVTPITPSTNMLPTFANTNEVLPLSYSTSPPHTSNNTVNYNRVLNNDRINIDGEKYSYKSYQCKGSSSNQYCYTVPVHAFNQQYSHPQHSYPHPQHNLCFTGGAQSTHTTNTIANQ